MSETTVPINVTSSIAQALSYSNTQDTYTYAPSVCCTFEDLERLELKSYVDDKLKQQAEKTYDIISKLIQWNIDKEEFVNLLLSEEEG